MNKIREVKLGLLTLLHYEREAYEEEINEIISCISNNRIYDEAPALSRSNLIDLLESLSHSLFVESKALGCLERLRDYISNKPTIEEDIEYALRIKIRRILLGS